MKLDGFEHFVRSCANKLGIDITRYRPATTEVGRLSTMLAHHNVDLVFDVGANTGQFAIALRASGFSGIIVSFEPLSAAHAALSKASAKDESWLVAPRIAIGDRAGSVDIHIAGNSVSSSLLGMLKSHLAAAPTSDYVGSEPVQMQTLDSLAKEYCGPDARVFIKIDTQGFESQVLDGAADLLKRAAGLQLELSLLPLYESQILYDELVERVRQLGFTPWAIWPALFDPNTGRMMQADATFFRD
jgi:FkbM family methyltransferase